MIPGFDRQQKPQGERKPPFKPGMSLEDKISQIILEKRFENTQADMRRARVYLLMDLFFRGYQNLGPWDDVRGWPSYDDEPMDFQENRFRRGILINMGNMIRMEPPPVVRPASGDFNDVEAAVTGQDAWEKAKEEIGYDTLSVDKAQQKCLFGNTFIYSGYQTDRRHGILMVPKMKFEDIEIPGAAICPNCGTPGPMGMPVCPECGMPMQQHPPMQTSHQVQTGFEERPKGQLFSTAFSPLEIKIRQKVKGLQNQPYLIRMWREDVELLNYVFNQDFSASTSPRGGSANGSDAMTRIQSILGGITGNVSGARSPYWRTDEDFSQTDVVMGWIRPQCYKGDKELEKEAPDGLVGIVVNGKLPDWHPESIDDVWTHEICFPNTHSGYGDGFFDNPPIQRALNSVNQLQMRHMEYDTIPIRLYDDSLVVEEDFTNDPAKKWIKCATSLEKGLDAAVRDLPAQQLSYDVQAWKTQILQADQDISGATDPIAGKIGGANTPYSAQILAVEQGQIRFIPGAKYNKPAVRDHVRQILTLAQKNWTDPRTLSEIDKNTGKTSWKTFTGEDLSKGNWTIYIGDGDNKPTTRGEQMAAMDAARNLGIDPIGSPRLRLQTFERLGLDPAGDVMSTQARRAHRIIERMKAGEMLTPNPMIDDAIQVQVMQEYLASEQGDDLQMENPTAWQSVLAYMQTLLQMAAMKANALGAMGIGPAPGAPQQGGPPPSGPQQPNQPKPEKAQSPVPQDQQRDLPPNPARQQQAAGG